MTDALEGADTGEASLVVMDTAPSGHALRLLEMPALVQDWARALMSILLKYQPVTGVGELGAVLLRLSQGLGRLRALLTDPGARSFVAVTRAAALPRAENGRLHRDGFAACTSHVPAASSSTPWAGARVRAVGRRPPTAREMRRCGVQIEHTPRSHPGRDRASRASAAARPGGSRCMAARRGDRPARKRPLLVGYHRFGL